MPATLSIIPKEMQGWIKPATVASWFGITRDHLARIARKRHLPGLKRGAQSRYFDCRGLRDEVRKYRRRKDAIKISKLIKKTNLQRCPRGRPPIERPVSKFRLSHYGMKRDAAALLERIKTGELTVEEANKYLLMLQPAVMIARTLEDFIRQEG